ncbi:MAG TPA: hypothetical protein VLM75_13965 [Spirochaetota bacterium]|nr:hypothetical protein [Spirochaetota bacterium]
MAQKSDEIKKLERRAKAMLLDKDIPPAKMDIVRSLLNNTEIASWERYNTIISLIQTCPDKAPPKQRAERVELKPRRPLKRTQTVEDAAERRRVVALEPGGAFVNALFGKYKSLKLFRKRYLIHAPNKLGIGIRKRLIPSRRLLTVLGSVIAAQETILSRLPTLMQSMLDDPAVDEPIVFNYLRRFRDWMIATPLVQYSYDSIKWMDRGAFEDELKDFVVPFFSFLKLPAETREMIILQLENRLRMTDDLRKEETATNESDAARREKEKRNLEREKQIYEYMMLLRSFLPGAARSDSALSQQLRQRYGLQSYPQLLLALMEALVFRREIDYRDLDAYYGVRPPVVSAIEWDYSLDAVKKAGKDPESRKRRHIDSLRQRLVPYEVLYDLLNLKIDGRDLLLRAFEEQWRMVDRRQRDFENIHDEDFISFLDGCVNYFNNCFVPVIDGSVIRFEDRTRNSLEGAVFALGVFAAELSGLSQVLSEMHFFKTNNPTLVLGREEVRRIFQGKIPSMQHVERFVSAIGRLFFEMGVRMQAVYDMHRRWAAAGAAAEMDSLRSPLERETLAAGDDAVAPLPFHDCRISGFENARALSKTLSGRYLVADSPGGVIEHIAAFSYQLAYECQNENIRADLSRRKELMEEIRELAGKGS